MTWKNDKWYKSVSIWFFAAKVLSVVVMLPIFLNWIVDVNTIQSVMSEDTWLNFWGSYIGAIGTIFLGTLALIQNQRLSKANDRLAKMQNLYFNTLIKPSFDIIGDIKTEYLGKELDQNQNVLTLKDLDESYLNAKITIEIKNKSFIDITEFCIKKLEWNVGNQTNIFF